MAWVCSVCSTNNEDIDDVCKVCDSHKRKFVRTLTKKRVNELGLHGNVKIPEEFNAIGDGAFEGRSDIYSVELHRGVKQIGHWAFASCVNLKKVTGEIELTSIRSRAFFDCKVLDNTFKNGIKYVADDAFQNRSTATASVFSEESSIGTSGVCSTEKTEKNSETDMGIETKAETCAVKDKAASWGARFLLGGIALGLLATAVSLIVAFT